MYNGLSELITDHYSNTWWIDGGWVIHLLLSKQHIVNIFSFAVHVFRNLF